nr:transposase [Streptomyces exfoliatus]
MVEPLLPSGGRARGRWRDHRHVLEGIVFKFRTGLPWRDLPERFGPWQTVHGRFARWAADGTFDRPLSAAQSRAEVDWLVAIDSTIVRATSSPAGSGAGNGAAASTRPPTGVATSWNAASTGSSNGVASPPATTSVPTATSPPSPSPAPSSGSTHDRQDGPWGAYRDVINLRDVPPRHGPVV